MKMCSGDANCRSGDGIVFSRIEIFYSDRVLLVIGLSCFQSGELSVG